MSLYDEDPYFLEMDQNYNPDSVKLAAVQEKVEVILAFLAWAGEQKNLFLLSTEGPIWFPPEDSDKDLIMEFFKINQGRLAEEEIKKHGKLEA